MQFIPFHTSCKFSPFRSAPDKERNGAEQSKQENIVFSSTMTLTTCMEWKNGTERNGQNKKTEFSSTLTLTTGKNGTDRNGTERWKVTTCMEWNKLHLQECSQDKERNGAEQSKQENIVFSSTMTLTTCMEWNKRKGINCKQSTRGQHLSRLKASVFFPLPK
jgi:hypothetical protein